MEIIKKIINTLPKEKVALVSFIAGLVVMAIISFFLHRTPANTEGKTYEDGYSEGYAVGFDEGFYAAEDELDG